MNKRIKCPACNNVNDYQTALLGVLGLLRHFRCRFCGMMWSKSKPARPALSFKRKG